MTTVRLVANTWTTNIVVNQCGMVANGSKRAKNVLQTIAALTSLEASVL
jgi:hypothetical protein